MSKLTHGSKYGVVMDMTVHMPSADEQLKEEKDKVAAANNADKALVKVSVARIPPKYSKPLQSTAGKLYNTCKEHAMHINGQYVIPPMELEPLWVKLFGHNDVSSTVPAGGLVGQFYSYKDALAIACKDGSLAKELELGDLASQVQAIDCSEVLSKYGVDISLDVDMKSPHVMPILARMDKDAVKRLGDRVEADAAKRYNASLTEIAGQLGTWFRSVLGDIINRGGAGKKGTHFETMIGKIKDLIDRLPSYNVTNDPVVTEIYNQIYATFATVEKNDFKDEERRKALTEKAKDILAAFDKATTSAPVAPIADTVENEVKSDTNSLPESLVGLVG